MAAVDFSRFASVLSELGVPVISRGRKLGLTALRAYLAIAMVMVIVKVVMIAAH